MEFAGAAAGSRVETRYKEIYRDPPDSGLESSFQFRHWVRGLRPCTGYLFRVRGVNGYGPGEFAYRVAWTRPAAPAQPRVCACSSDAATLRWGGAEGFLRREDELRALFRDADSDGSGAVSREELRRLTDDGLDARAEIRAFLVKLSGKLGLDEDSLGAVFDLIEGDDDDTLSWEEFRAFFMNEGWADGGVRASAQSSAAGSLGSAQTATFVVSRCVSEATDEWAAVQHTTRAAATVHRLEAGRSYRFRVHCVNPDGATGAPSPSVVVHAMLETPAPPQAWDTLVEPRSVALHWKGRGGESKDRALVVIAHLDPIARITRTAPAQDMLGQWAGQLERESSVSVEVAFSKYDTDRSGCIDKRELVALLEDLNVEPSEERVAEALLHMDGNGDGAVSYEEFCDWWRSREALYTVKRSEALPPAPARASASCTSSARSEPKVRRAPLPVVSYRGTQRESVIAGLVPNRMYHFALRQTGPRSNSMLSLPLALMTAPLPCPAPVAVRCSATCALVKWYPPEYGAFKFVLQLQTGRDGRWVVAYNGQDSTFTSTTLAPDTDYQARVLAVNFQGREGAPSQACSFRTLPRSAREPFAMRSAGRLAAHASVCVLTRRRH